ncbi:MAG: P-II family nitrogen regulator [Clostridia bacterium]|nr:P-II family nitrogen regulator [Clostridia bacterium]
MKKIEIITRPDKLEDIKEILDSGGQFGMTVSMVSGCGLQKGRKQIYRGAEVTINLLPKIKVELVVKDGMAGPLVEAITQRLRTGEIGDGKIFIYEVLDAVKIRTGEIGESAL